MAIVKIDMEAKKLEKTEEYVAEEKHIHIFLNKRHYSTIMCTPKDLKELAVGHLLAEGIIKTVEEIEKITIKKDKCYINLKPNINLKIRLKLVERFSLIIPSACGGPYQPHALKTLKKIDTKTTVKAETIQSCVNKLNCLAETYRKTHGVHAAAIYKTDGTLLAFAEDVGRHNAVDKAIGKCALQKMAFNECLITLSGRLTADIVLKAARVGIPIIASLAVALDSGIEIAKKTNLTLIGFVRGWRMNVYNAPERILLS
ncbi:MAG: formate dehydrogenase accessory sulfurtransferase FdhD [Candidatus Bathyarchaeia archaeon]